MKRILLSIIFLLLSRLAIAQGMPIDSLFERFSEHFPKQMLASLRNQIQIRYDEQRVWGLAIGDFSNDTLPDLAISLYDIDNPTREVTVYLLLNVGNQSFRNILRKKYSYVETPIEVGLTTDGSVVTVMQKTGDDQWYQEGYTFYAGDLTLVDDYQTNKEEIPAISPKAKAMGHSRYRDFETLLTKETYFATKDLQNMMEAKFYTFPSYNRLRSVYPGYGKDMSDTTKQFIIKGLDYRRDAKDLSIHRALALFDDEYIYFSITVTDDAVYGGSEKMENDDRVALWFDTWGGANRYFQKTKKGGIPTFRTETDSTVYSLIFSAPDVGGRSAKLTISSVAELSEIQKEASKSIRSSFTRDTTSGLVSGYTIKARIPFAFLGYESNPVTAFENRASEMMFETKDAKSQKNAKVQPEEIQPPKIGFTAIVYDIDNPKHPEETTIQATSNFRTDDPTSFGEINFIPSRKFYGMVQPLYLKEFTQEMIEAGY
ncbi:MAG: hypothetical protein WCH46_11335 [bacterium]